jgi:hypothetical protein
MQPDPAAGFDSGRLHMALSEAFAAEHDWVSVEESVQVGGRGGGGGDSTAGHVGRTLHMQPAKSIYPRVHGVRAAAPTMSSSAVAVWLW